MGTILNGTWLNKVNIPVNCVQHVPTSYYECHTMDTLVWFWHVSCVATNHVKLWSSLFMSVMKPGFNHLSLFRIKGCYLLVYSLLIYIVVLMFLKRRKFKQFWRNTKTRWNLEFWQPRYLLMHCLAVPAGQSFILCYKCCPSESSLSFGRCF